MLYFRRWFKFPSPKELGMSEHDCAMPSNLFPNENNDRPTWEMFYARLKHDYPVKFFFASTLPDFIHMTYLKLIGWRLRDFKCWVESFFLRRDHLLDLRQPDKDTNSVDYYRHGWLETDHKILFSVFNCLTDFVEHQMDNFYRPSDEEVEKDDGTPGNYQYAGLRKQRGVHDEIMAIYHWWLNTRKQDAATRDELLHKWSKCRRSKNPETKRLWDEFHAKEEANEREEDEMIARLMKIRRHLWT